MKHSNRYNKYTIWTWAKQYKQYHLHELCLFIRGEQVRNFSAVQQCIDILEKTLFLDLRVGDEEGDFFILTSCYSQKFLQVFSPIGPPIAFRNLRLVDIYSGHERREPSHRLPSTASNSDEQRVATRNAQHSTNFRQVF